MADEDEYAGARSRHARRSRRVLPPGRGFLGADLEVQVRARRRRSRAARRPRSPRQRPPWPTAIPTRAPIAARSPRRSRATRCRRPASAARPSLGLATRRWRPPAILDEGSFLVAGPRRSGADDGAGDDRLSLLRREPGAPAAPARAAPQLAAEPGVVDVRGDGPRRGGDVPRRARGAVADPHGRRRRRSCSWSTTGRS